MTQKQLPTLYARGENNKILEWTIELKGNKYRTNTGAQGFGHVLSAYTEVSGKNTGKKNETSPEEQAYKEAKALWDKKIKSKGYWENIDDIDKETYISPMLANKYKDYIGKIDFANENWIIQCKFNGNRCVASKGKLHTRTGELYTSLPHIVESLKPLFLKYPNIVLDGEIYNYNLRQQLNELAKICRKTVHITPEDIKRSEELAEYHIYDGYIPDVDLGEDSPYELRKQWIDENVVGKYKYCKEVKSYPVKNEDDINKYYNIFLDDLQEGAILRKADEPYYHKRVKYLLKIKPCSDAEAILMDISEGNGNWAGAAKIATLKWENKSFNATFKGDYATLKELLKNKQNYIGKEITFQFYEYTGLGIPNFAQIDTNNCFK